MNLKESFRYHNYLEGLMTSAQRYLMQSGNVTRIESTHMRSKSNPEAVDETVDSTPEREIKCDNNRMIDFLVAVANERCALALAVEKAKQEYKDVCYDAELVANKCRQSVAHTLRALGATKCVERTTQGMAYKFNAEGNQMPYRYDVKEVVSIDFDQNKVKAIAKKFAEDANYVSDLLDHAMVDAVVDFTPNFSVNNSFEEAFEEFTAQDDIKE